MEVDKRITFFIVISFTLLICINYYHNTVTNWTAYIQQNQHILINGTVLLNGSRLLNQTVNVNTTTVKGVESTNVQMHGTIYMESIGRMGNILFQVTTLYGITKKTNRHGVYYLQSDAYMKNLLKQIPFDKVNFPNIVFKYGRLNAKTRSQIKYYRELEPDVNHSFSKILATLPREDVLICCFFHRYWLWVNYWEDVMTLLQFTPEVQSKANNVLNKVTKNRQHILRNSSTQFVTALNTVIVNQSVIVSNSNQPNPAQHMNKHNIITIGVHVRLTDVCANRNCTLPKISFWKKSMDYFTSKFSNSICVFLVCSDNIKWCETNINFKGKYIFFIKGQTMVEDFATLVSTNHTIVGRGTFSWWVSFLNGGDAVYYVPNVDHLKAWGNDLRNKGQWTPMSN